MLASSCSEMKVANWAATRFAISEALDGLVSKPKLEESVSRTVPAETLFSSGIDPCQGRPSVSATSASARLGHDELLIGRREPLARLQRGEVVGRSRCSAPGDEERGGGGVKRLLAGGET